MILIDSISGLVDEKTSIAWVVGKSKRTFDIFFQTEFTFIEFRAPTITNSEWESRMDGMNELEFLIVLICMVWSYFVRDSDGSGALGRFA